MSLHEFLGEERMLEWFYSKNSSNTGIKVGYRRVSGKIGLTNKYGGSILFCLLYVLKNEE